MSGDGRTRDLRGAVICCTAVPPEQRTQYGAFALQMGAEHKLDLTSEVTHLLVGDTNTPKYKYVAREREEVKVLRPQWIEAVREAWMKDESFDLNALEAEYRLPTLTGLTICITGFDDLSFRAHLQQKIGEEGGRYMGNLTKRATHLIAYKAEGQKYQFATQWQKHIVTLQWLKDSLERGMQLDETRYHPSIAPEEQGKGAWNREAKHANQLGKRSRPEEPVAEPSRKLRRTASARLVSQTDAMWSEICANPGNDLPEREPLYASISMPPARISVEQNTSHVAPAQIQVRPAESLVIEGHTIRPKISELGHGYFHERYFILEKFDRIQTDILRGILLSRGGTLLENWNEIDNLQHLNTERCFLIVPHNMRTTSVTDLAKRVKGCHVVTELWVEICVEQKRCVPPSTYPLGNLLLPRGAVFSRDEKSQNISINSSGFPGIQRNHVAKAVQVAGATYEEILKPGVSVMICYSASSSIDKIRHAREWKVAIVTPDWLWASLQGGSIASFEEYAVKFTTTPSEGGKTAKKSGRMQVRDSFANEERVLGQSVPAFPDEVPTQPLPKRASEENTVARDRPGSDFMSAQQASARKKDRGARPSERVPMIDTKSTGRDDKAPDVPVDLSLQETTGNSPPKARSPSPKKKKPLFRTLDGAGSVAEGNQDGADANETVQPTLEAKLDSQDAIFLNGAIQDLLNQTGRGRSLTSSALAAQTNKQPLSRALSNVSNASMPSRARASRAGSVSSVNTDGLGSEIAMEPSDRQRVASTTRARGSFVGRAKARDESQAVPKPSSLDLQDADMYAQGFAAAAEESAPPLTQLGYEDPEEAVALRARLAEKRRKKARAGQEAPLPSPPPVKKCEGLSSPRRRIRDEDDDYHSLDAKWAGGRRTRQRGKTPPALKGLDEF